MGSYNSSSAWQAVLECAPADVVSPMGCAPRIKVLLVYFAEIRMICRGWPRHQSYLNLSLHNDSREVVELG